MPTKHKTLTLQASTAQPLNFFRHKARSKRGIALISVLAMVMLLTVLTVAFMMRAGTERQSSKFYQSEASTRELSDTTLNLVEGLINEGTNQSSAGIYYSWASQPGAIRVFDKNGAAFRVFKLYSTQAMAWSALRPPIIYPTVPTFMAADVPPANWYTQPGIWVDLNAPVNTDPNPQPITVGAKQYYLGQATYTHFPVLDPRDPTAAPGSLTYDAVTTKMDGFSITGAPVDSTASTDGNMIDSTQVPNPAPMPVQWLYVLQNGTLLSPDAAPDAKGNYTFTSGSTATPPSAANPVVGRIAFWTDDETCKVNINTAAADGLTQKTSNGHTDPENIAYGTYWSPPYFAAPDDWGGTTNAPAPGSGPFLAGFASAEPITGEYQRYPGHPSTVALANVLAGLGVTTSVPNLALDRTQSITTVISQTTTPLYSDMTATQPGITPRYTFGGTKENVVPTFDSSTYTATLRMTQPPTSVFRLYPTLSEMLFIPTTTGTARNISSVNTTGTSTTVSRQQMESGRFFLTTHSRAPELNLFGLPRVSMWPISTLTSNHTAIENLLAFCTSIGGPTGEIYSFQRVNQIANSAVGGARDATMDISIPRNITLLKYLDYLTRQSIPGFGGDFFDKNYGSLASALKGQNDQILSEIFDYIRSTNIQDALTPGAPLTSYGTQSSFSAYSPGWYGSNWGYAQVVPSLAKASLMGGNWATATQGNASFPRLVEASLQFVAMGKGGTSAANLAIPVNPAEVTYRTNSWTNMFGVGDSAATTFYNHPASGVGNAVNPYDAPGAANGPPVGSTNKVSAVANYNVRNASSASASLLSGIPPDGTTAIQAFLFLTFVNPAQDWMYESPFVWVSVSGLNTLLIGDAPPGNLNLGFSPADCMVFGSGQDWNGGGRSGYYPMQGSIQGKQIWRTNANSPSNNPFGGMPFCSQIIPVKTASRMGFSGGTITIRLYDAPAVPAAGFYTGPTATSQVLPTPDAGTDTCAPLGGHWLQTYQISFPATAAALPNGLVMPTIPPNPNSYPALPQPNYYAPYNPSPVYWAITPYITPNIAYGPSSGTNWTATCYEQTGPIVGLPNPAGSLSPQDNYSRWYAGGQAVPFADSHYIGTGDVVQSMILTQAWSDPRILLSQVVPASAWTTHPNFSSRPFAHNLFSGMVVPVVGNGKSPWPAGGTSWTTAATVDYIGTLAGNIVENSLGGGSGIYDWAPCNFSALGINKAPTTSSGSYPPTGFPPDWDNGVGNGSDGPWTNKADEGSDPDPGDGGFHIPYNANPMNQEPALFTPNRQVSSPGMLGSLPTGVPQISGNSLSNVLVVGKPAGWQTLLFRPGPGAAAALNGTGGVQAHPGEGVPVTSNVFSPPYTSPPDHLWMDLFWMPVVEPYAISEPMSTAGKVNLNYQIVPFTYIKRATAIRAAMATEEVAAVALNQSSWKGVGGYPTGIGINGPMSSIYTQTNARYPIDLDVTQTQFDSKFANYDVYRSASQICDVFLVPMDIPNALPGSSVVAPSSPGTYAEAVTPAGNYTLPSGPTDLTGVKQFASDWYIPVTAGTTPAPYALVGDNVREQPYAHLYGKITTKSNTYTVYYRVQALKTALTSDPTKWNEATGTITGEYRGSTTIERFIDPNEGTVNGGAFTPSIPDAAAQTAIGNPTSLEGYYKWRVVENHQFAP